MKKKQQKTDSETAIERKIEAIGEEVFEKEYSPESSEKELVEIKENYKKPSFTFKEEKFINEYFIDGNEKEAAIRAGYSPWTAAQSSNALMKNPKIEKEIEIRREKMRDRYEISHDRVAEEYSKLAFSNIKDFIDSEGNIKSFNEISDYAAAAMSSVELDNIYIKGKEEDGSDDKIVSKIKKFKLVDKKQTLDSISKMFGYTGNDNDQLLLDMGLSKLLKMFPPEMQEQLKLAIMQKIEGKLLK